MQQPERFSDLPEYAFPRLRALLEGTPAGGPLLPMSLGEPRHPLPPFLGEELARHHDLYGRYPPNEGYPELREAIAGWLQSRFGIAGDRADPERHVFPLNGTREGLFAACLALVPERKNGQRPAVLIPNPFYQCYAVAALAAGAEPIYVPATPESGFLPDFESLPEDLLARTAAVYLCSPANPQGVVAGMERWKGLIALAEQHDFFVFADECYSEIWRDAPPPSALQASQEMGADPERVLAFHSLSKRSNLPGLRSGFCAGGPKAIAAMRKLRAYTGAPLPGPIQMASAAVWRDEAHVDASRALYHEKFAMADRILGNMEGYRPPEAGFFLWLDVSAKWGDGEAATLHLWKETGVRVLPGAYLSRPSPDWLGGGDPGEAYVRIALVESVEDVERGLTLIREALG
ncbi:aminotransferase class I/II-fold pyridoxal phosphate-dependent enzyme [Albimonas pacifica]|uniref:Aspartate/methionine/tyrosine aminotransferase n=1 Tax=Albimonas pacifica TaxID=1114924 RepID=A0A1I3LX52_9RHOB|nr:aminotransferase class I/II-fold pyridoxal phosphate-dependent enzyme [Albimonas pacifica]SFI89319.1 Aspartate/methionine/tyrosine aminotransferase [Albimonas pacifica]